MVYSPKPLPKPLPVQSGTGEPLYEQGLEVPHIYRPDMPYVRDSAESDRQHAWAAAGRPAPEAFNSTNDVWKQTQSNIPSPTQPLMTPEQKAVASGRQKKSLAEIMAENSLNQNPQ
jgi:hypothetical protein